MNETNENDKNKKRGEKRKVYIFILCYLAYKLNLDVKCNDFFPRFFFFLLFMQSGISISKHKENKREREGERKIRKFGMRDVLFRLFLIQFFFFFLLFIFPK